MRAKGFLHGFLGSMEEQTLKLAQKLARETSIEENNADSDSSEARDGHPMPLKSMAAKLEEKVKGFRSVSVFKIQRQIFSRQMATFVYVFLMNAKSFDELFLG